MIFIMGHVGSGSSWYKCQAMEHLCLEMGSASVLLFLPNMFCEVGVICFQCPRKDRMRSFLGLWWIFRLILCVSHLVLSSFFFPLQDKFSGTHCFLKMSLIYSKCNLPQHSHWDKISYVFKCLRGNRKSSLCIHVPTGIKSSLSLLIS